MKIDKSPFDSNLLVGLDQSELLLSKIKKWGACLEESNVWVPNTIFVFAKVKGFDVEKLKRFLRSNELQEHKRSCEFELSIILIVDNSLPEAWSLLELGISDVIYFKEVNEFVNYCKDLKFQNSFIKNILSSQLVKSNLIGCSTCWMEFLKEIITASISGKGNIFLYGETGTGKELLARFIHTIDKVRSKNNLVILDCTTIIPELSGSELFGHEKGAFTNASYHRDGAFSLADGGSLFMDEIGELPVQLQSEFLRVLQEKQFKKVGGNFYKSSDFRLISATNRNLIQMIKNGSFRSDLYFRISDHSFKVPALRERREDIPGLARYFLSKALDAPLDETPHFDKGVMEFLMHRDYPGNIRELKQLVFRIAKNHHHHHLVTPGEVPLAERAKIPKTIRFEKEGHLYEIMKKNLLSGVNLTEIKRQTMREAIKAALDINNQNKHLAARSLGITVRAIQKFLQKENESNEEDSKEEGKD
ncbi:sigma 54-interacting transcriptional regulator [Algoriphagus zhangzhouensis]|uniref:Sigma-54 interaction domain-containing protein n=1 Tax=Algoriphagus zhangzhouensis TaxID=1073327 RepID=A0A1M7Z7S6_9BACT|nr:sigma 54-interacting transcriptional regulator [Algoriphagus zhangzhouensis]TDY49314.1 sigma-54 interacting transcriptional regulator [Algoriphagus zhangzhouensis]SHO60756.1 Sigma-54 interaction domain-containing protein [Algoriphagus zhangzhouensis]